MATRESRVRDVVERRAAGARASRIGNHLAQPGAIASERGGRAWLGHSHLGSWRSSSQAVDRASRPRQRAARPRLLLPADRRTGQGRGDDLGADVARADIDVRADGHAARAARECPDEAGRRRHRGAAAGRRRRGGRARRPGHDRRRHHGRWDVGGAAGIDGPKGRKAESTDEFGIASVSKVLLAALVLKLADQGRIELDAPIGGTSKGSMSTRTTRRCVRRSRCVRGSAARPMA